MLSDKCKLRGVYLGDFQGDAVALAITPSRWSLIQGFMSQKPFPANQPSLVQDQQTGLRFCSYDDQFMDVDVHRLSVSFTIRNRGSAASGTVYCSVVASLSASLSASTEIASVTHTTSLGVGVGLNVNVVNILVPFWMAGSRWFTGAFWSASETEYDSMGILNKAILGKVTFTSCGNGFVEHGEECDGGSCCNASCRIRKNSFQCRAGTDCAFPTHCDGVSDSCPRVVYKTRGTPCR